MASKGILEVMIGSSNFLQGDVKKDQTHKKKVCFHKKQMQHVLKNGWVDVQTDFLQLSSLHFEVDIEAQVFVSQCKISLEWVKIVSGVKKNVQRLLEAQRDNNSHCSNDVGKGNELFSTAQ